MAKKDFDDFSNIGKGDSSNDYGFWDEGQKKKPGFGSGFKLILLLGGLWVPFGVILVTFYLLNRTQSAGEAEPVIMWVLFLVFVVFAFTSILIVFFWKKFIKVKERFEQYQTAAEKALEKDFFTTIIPITFDGETVRIIRYYAIHEFKFKDILWVNYYETNGQHGRQFYITFHDYKGKVYSVMASGKKTIAAVESILETILASSNHMMVSEGYMSKKARQCKKEYKARLEGRDNNL